jgi:hypothetical protein
VSEEVELLQTLLAAEHAAVYGYGVLGARLADAGRELAQQADDAHRARRARAARVPPTLAAYDVAVAGAPEALALAVRLEEGLGVRWRDLVGGTDDPALRILGLSGLTETAVRAARWRLAGGLRPGTVALPGVARTD